MNTSATRRRHCPRIRQPKCWRCWTNWSRTMMFKMSITRLLRPAFLAGTLATLVLGGFQQADTGPPSTEDRPVGAFQSIEFNGAAQLDILVGSAPSLSITGGP